MDQKRLSALVGAVLLAAVMGFFAASAMLESQAAPLAAATLDGGDAPQPTAGNGSESPAISSISSASASCYRPVMGTGACYIEWNYLYVTAASGSYVISMTVSIDDRLRSYHSGFFQTAMYIPNEMTAPGYKVACGTPGSGGTPGWGKSYAYTIRARDTSGLKAANHGSVTCPADVANVFVPLVRKK
jgi:hypothetical protein